MNCCLDFISILCKYLLRFSFFLNISIVFLFSGSIKRLQSQVIVRKSIFYLPLGIQVVCVCVFAFIVHVLGVYWNNQKENNFLFSGCGNWPENFICFSLHYWPRCFHNFIANRRKKNTRKTFFPFSSTILAVIILSLRHNDQFK